MAAMWLGTRRRRLALALLVLLLAVRVALPPILRSVLVSRANTALAGRFELGDVDLWLLRGGIALKDVALRAEDAAPADPPLVAFRRLYVRVGYVPFLRHTVRVEDFSLEGPAIYVERLKSGALVLPRPRAPQETPAPAASASVGASKPWNVVIDRARLASGTLRLRDHVVDPPENAELGLDALELRSFSLRYGAGAEPGHGSLEARFGDGVVRIATHVKTRSEGFAIAAKVDIANLPLDRTQLHVPELGWSGFTGRLDGSLALHVRPGGGAAAAGSLALRDLRVEVPGESEPALAWRRLDVDVERLDLVSRRADVRRVALDGARVLVKPRERAPLPLLAGRAAASPAAEPPAEAPAEPSPRATAPWTWRLGALEVTDSTVKVFLEPPPLEMGIVKAAISGLESRPGSTAQIALELREETGTIAIHGTVGLDPLTAALTARLEALPLEHLVAASGAAPVRLPGGVLSGEVTVRAEPAPLVVAGQLALADLSASPLEGQDFSLGWKQLELGVREIKVPGVLPADRASAGQPIVVDLEALRLLAPAVALTRTPEGLVLPGASTRPGGEAPPEPVAAPAAPQPATAPLAVTLGGLDIEKGEVSLLDRSVKPFYRGKISAIALRARGLRFPENVFEEFTFAATLPGNAPLSLTGRRGGKGVLLEANGKRIPLPQFNPYVTQAAGYSIGAGAASFACTVRWTGSGYESRNRIELDRLAVGGAEGDALFTQRFGVPLSLALGLMRDVHGRIALDVPIRGDRAGTRLDIGTIVAEALTHAIVNAIASPLKLLGALTVEGNKVQGFTPEPVEFAAGRPVVQADARGRVEQLANVLASCPALRVELHGRAGPADVRALQEAAVLADLEADRGVFGTVRNLASRGERTAIREALAARARGGSADLPPAQQARLDTWVAEKTIADDQLGRLAAARAEELRTVLGKDYGIDAARVAIGEPEVDREHGGAAVGVSLAAGS